jgi:DNA-binding LacI/PurR family transcriptional regulator
MASVRKLAKDAGVSIATVSRVLNNHPAVSDMARRKVLRAANDARYVARVGTRSTTNLAFVYTGETSLGSPFDAALMQGMSQGMEAEGYDLLVLHAERSRRDGETYSQLFQRKGVRGAILRTTSQTRQTCIDIADEKFPSVVVADGFEQDHVVSVHSDAGRACGQAIEHLLHLGHRRIAVTMNLVDDHDHSQRLAACRAALAEAGCPLEDRLILRVPAYRDAGAVALRQLMGMPDRPTAVFLTDPMAAVGLCHEAHRAGVKIPNELSVIGFDDEEQRFGTYPTMSAVCQNAEALGRHAFDRLSGLIEQRPFDDSQASPACWLELHETTAAPGVPGTSAGD